MTDVDRLSQFRFPVPAFVFTRAGADTPQHGGKNVGHVVDIIGASVAFLVECTDIGRNIGQGRACPLAGHIDVHVIKIFRFPGVDDIVFDHNVSL